MENGFEELESETASPPNAKLFVLCVTYFSGVLSLHNRYAFDAIEYLFSWILCPISFLDKIFKKRSRRHFHYDSMFYYFVERARSLKT